MSEARNVRRCNRFDVLDARAAVVCVIHLPGVCVGIQCRTNSIFADGVSEKLQAAFIELGNCRGVFCRIPEELALRRRIIAIRLQHGRGVRFDDAVDHHFHNVRVNPLVVELPASRFDCIDVLRAELRWIQKVRDVEAKGLLAIAAQLIVEVEILEVTSGAVHARQSVFIGPLDTPTESREIFAARGLRNNLRDKPLR